MTEEIEPQTNYTVKKFYTDKEYNELKQENELLKHNLVAIDKDGKYYFVEDNNKYRSALETIQRMVLYAWEKGKYLDGGLYNDLTNEFAKINEVLNPSV